MIRHNLSIVRKMLTTREFVVLLSSGHAEGNFWVTGMTLSEAREGARK